LFFAGLPAACDLITAQYGDKVVCFYGDESPLETASKLGLPITSLPTQTASDAGYDESRLSFARDLINSGSFESISPPDRSGYPQFGGENDSVLLRLDHSIELSQPPLMRAHIGPYLTDRDEAVRLYNDWALRLAGTGYLDVLSVGTSQLSQEQFGEDWEDRPNGGGVPINSEDEYRSLWEAARPMLVRTYAGTTNIPKLAKMYERTIHTAWHALSFWWFCSIDGRGPLSVLENLTQHFETARYIASTGKPLEPNVPHHFSFRGGDDITYIVSGVLAARAAARMGVKIIVLQIMFNTPKATWGIQDLAKARVLLKLVREIPGVRIILQPRAGLDYFSSNLNKARIQLAAVTAMMDDIEPENYSSPDIIHVVSYSEAVKLADPDIVDESIKITLAALEKYRSLKIQGNIAGVSKSGEIQDRERQLEQDATVVLNTIEKSIKYPYTPEGFYTILESGFLQVPYLWMCREEFPEALRWKTGMLKGGVSVIDDQGKSVPISERMTIAVQMALSDPLHSPGMSFPKVRTL
jgi:hypothetical protein